MPDSEKIDLLVSCGGTGGHFYPGLAVAREALRRGHAVRLYLGGKHADGQSRLAAGYGLGADATFAPPLPRGAIQALLFPFRFTAATWRCWRYLGRRRPRALLAMGSFAGVPLCLAARFRGIPVHLHEGNTIVGRANRLVSRWATHLHLGFPILNASAVRCPSSVTGMPLRPELCAARDGARPAEWRARLGLDPEIPLLLAFGGSLGAAKVNTAVAEAAASMQSRGLRFQLIHLTGQDDNAALIEAYTAAGVKALVKKSHEAMAEYLQAADLVTCRAGGSSLAELSYFGRAAVFVPLAIAADGHQLANARHGCSSGGGFIVTEDELSGEALLRHLQPLLADPASAAAAAEAMRLLGVERSAEKVCDALMAAPG
ncbi:MAG: hypothetical protein RL095_878 [Verrucomicrobiota bacterium]|jgi:UDP-N-acetylglucosamine--N-acetylmuramyl-(pentapeptide) pyrophosphoryl-undecaprenol N-acetylglucosamine transferase